MAMIVDAFFSPSEAKADVDDSSLPRASLVHSIQPVAVAAPLPTHPYHVATEELASYFNRRLWLCGSSSFSQDYIGHYLRELTDNKTFYLSSQVRKKAEIARVLLSRLAKPHEVEDPCQLLFDIALAMNIDREQQGFGLSPFTFFVHQTKGFSAFSKTLEKIAQALIDEAMLTNRDFQVLMQKNLAGIDDSIQGVRDRIASEQKTIETQSARVSEEIASISISREEKIAAIEPSLHHYEQKVKEIKTESAKKISELNKQLAAFVGGVKQRVNQLKSELSVVTRVSGIFSSFVDYFNRKKSESPSPPPFRFS